MKSDQSIVLELAAWGPQKTLILNAEWCPMMYVLG